MNGQDTSLRPLDTLQLEKYQRLLDTQGGGRLLVALLNETGALLAASQVEIAQSTRERIRQAFEARYSDAGRREDAGILISALPLSFGGSENYLVLCCDGGEADAASFGGLEALGECIVAEYLAGEELDDMAAELERRYEELNLVYSLEEVAERYAHGDSESVLRRMLRDYGDYLEMAAVVLSVPSAQIELSIRSADSALSGCEVRCWQGLQAGLLEQLRAGEDSVIANQVGEDLARTGTAKPALRVAGVPVRDVHGGMQGMVAVLKKADQCEFTNSDRRLLRVLSEQVAVVVNANYDSLTGLLNRRGFETRLNAAIHSAGEQQISQLMLVDIDQFSVLNDTYGHAAGDELLKRVATQLLALFGDGCSISRLSGDEFALLLDADTATAKRLAEHVARALRGLRFSWRDRLFEVSATVAVVQIDGSMQSTNAALSAADLTATLSKQAGRGNVSHYDPEASSVRSHSSTVEWVPRIQWALAEDRILLYAQEIRPAPGCSEPGHYEILLRLRDEHDEIISPYPVITAAEHYRLMPEIDRRVVARAITSLRGTLSTYPQLPLNLSVNLSGQSLTDEFFAFLRHQLSAGQDISQHLCFEITETAAVSNLGEATRLIDSLRATGVRFSLDDFGSGLSSFGYLKSLPVDYLKIDGSIVREVLEDPVSVAMVEAINRVAHLMGLKTVAEYVENRQISTLVAAIGVDFLQGYEIGRPEPLEQLIGRLLIDMQGTASG